MNTKFVLNLIRSALTMILAAGVPAVFAQSDNHWVATWSAAPYLVESANMPPSPGLTNNTLRQVVRVSIGGDTLRLKLTNVNNTQATELKAVNIAVSSGGSKIEAATLKSLKFNGSASASLAAGASVTSDPIAFPLTPSMRVAITILYGATSSNMTGHVGSRTNSYIVSGDKVTATELTGSVSTPHWYSINTIDVRTPQAAQAVGIIGNSITDGYGLTPDLQNRWTDIFSERLLANEKTKNVAVLNMGIGATTVLGTAQTAGVTRFQRDILDQQGIGWVIIFHGVNDIGSSNASSANLIAGLKQMASAAKAKGLKVYGGTILPFNGNSYYSAAHETVRKEVNYFIRHDAVYDGVIDFDKTMRNPSDTTRLQAAVNNDWLHPSTAGYKVMGESIDLKLFENGISGAIGQPTLGRTGTSLEWTKSASGASAVRFEIPAESYVSLRVRSLNGRVTTELAGRTFAAGSHTVELAQDLPQGVYLCSIHAQGVAETRTIYVAGR
ncbi:MAG: SGNH/GDSL hydrolase family protein [Fibrobacterota bacterium]|nr:MAG: SGNH/GDSL hydrolase family protein [Fibrobacterota bacterium]